jgi:hypothetical protein
MNDTADMHSRDDVIRELARDVVAENFGVELPTFDETADAYFDDPAGTLPSRTDETLGSGIVLTVAAAVALFVADKGVDFLLNVAAEGAGSWLARTFRRRSSGAVSIPPVPADRAAELHEVLVRAASQWQLSEADVNRIADGVFARLQAAGGGAI